jgi:ABC-type nitrate/sulfonate/bicarbonate transport system substrate-binding protein
MPPRRPSSLPPANPLTRRTLLQRAALLAAAGGALPLLSACGDGDSDGDGDGEPAAGGQGAGAAEPRTIRTCVYARNHASSPLYWQQFAPEGVTVDVAVVTSAAEVQQGLEAGNLDFGLMGPYNTIISQAEQGINSRIIGMVSRQGIGLIARAGGGYETVADLAGTTIAVPPPGIQSLVLNTLLARAGITEDVELVPLAYADHPTALERGDVDAYVGTEPLCTQSIVTGTGVRIPEIYTSPAGDLNTALWASPAMLEDPEACRMAARMQRDAAELLTPGGTNDEEVWRDLLVTQFGYTEEVYEAVLDNVGAEWRFDETRIEQVEGAGSLLLEQGLISEEPDYEALYAREYWDL